VLQSRRSAHVLALVFVLSSGSLTAFAQTAQMTGRVTDSSGGVVPDVSITVRNIATGTDRSTTTNEGGYWTVPLLPPGSYRVTVEHPGFRPIVRSGIVLEVDQRAELNFGLELGAVAERIEVEAAATQLNTVEASRGQVIENRRIVELPLNGRVYNELALLSSGTVQPLGAARYAGFSSGGMRVTQNNFMLDGVDNNGIELAGAQRRSEMVQPSIDAIQEFKVQTNAYAAEYGRAMGSVVNATTKSGSNQLHGTAFEFLRNEILDAKNFFDPPDRPKPPFKRNQYGFALGGPVFIPKIFNGKNKAFFFGDFEGTRIRVSNTNTSTIPTTAMRSGDFSELLAQRNVTIIDPITNAPFAGNIIPETRQDPVARTLIALYPAPMNRSVVSNFVYQSPAPQDVSKYDVRADVNFGSKDTWSWRLSGQDANIPAPLVLPPPAYGGGALDSAITGLNLGTTWTHIWAPNLIMSVRGAWNYGYFQRDSPAQTNGELLNRKYGIKAGTDLPGGLSQMNITGYQALGTGAFNPVQRDSQNRQLAGDLTWTHGTHTVKVGSGLLRSQNNIYNINNELGGPFQFNGRYTRDGMADFLLGMASQFTWNTRTQVNLRSWNISGYAQDDWKITPSLTLNLGARYEIVLPFLDKRDRMGIFDDWTDPNNPRLIYAGAEGHDRYNRAMFGTDKNNVMPRVGFAYKLGSKTVVRSGFGTFYGYLEPYGDAEYLLGNPPFAYGVTLSSSASVPALLLQNGPPAGALELARATGLTFIAYERKPNMGRAYQWNLNIQRELTRDWMFEVGYSASRGVHLLRRYDDNFSPPGAGDVNAKRRYKSIAIPNTGIVTSPLGPIYGYHGDGNAIYHALETKVEKRFSAGFTLLSSYTFSKNIGDVCGNAASGNPTGCGFQDLRNLRVERSLDNQDQPHRFVTSGVYELPFGKGRRWGSSLPRAVSEIFGGWSTGSIVVWSSGLPYSATVQGNQANTGTFDVVNRPNITEDIHAGDRTLDRDFNTTAFATNAQYTVGNAGRNILRGRSSFNWDFSALRDFALRERLKLQFRFEAFHFSNTPRFGQAGAVVGTANFGRITSADTPRNLQFGLKLIW
jgi:Carboxypeptidase regulatory-like domain